MRFKSVVNRGLHNNIGGVPEHDELAKCEVAEPAAEIAVVDEELWCERIDLHSISLMPAAKL